MTVTATDFKTRCLALIEEMEKTREPITITRRGKPVAVLNPAPKKGPWKDLGDIFKGKMKIMGDIVNSDPTIKYNSFSED